MKAGTYRNYLLAVLLLILAFNTAERMALGLVLQNIKADLLLSDTQLGFLTGMAFAVFYSTLGVPIARWADRGNRVAIISITTALWCVALALCGFARSFVQLLLTRVGVAVGEAGCIPPAQSLIADYFTRAERPRALSRYMMGAALGAVIGFFWVGWSNEFYGWRTTLLALGVPGLALAALSWFTLREPRHRGEMVSSHTTQPSFAEACRALWRNATFRHLVLFHAVVSFFGFGMLQWQPTFFVRSYGMQTGELGTWLAVIAGAGSLLGTYWGGELAARHAAYNESLQLRATAVVYSSFGLFSALIYLSPDRYWAFAFLALATVGGATALGPLYATIQTLVPERLRAMSIAIIYLVSNLIGLGFGPLVAGALSDGLRPWAGDESLRYALLILCPGYLWGGWHLLCASRTVTRDLETVQVERAVLS
jgi:MFS family permease